jgi:hypothetical protein
MRLRSGKVVAPMKSSHKTSATSASASSGRSARHASAERRTSAKRRTSVKKRKSSSKRTSKLSAAKRLSRSDAERLGFDPVECYAKWRREGAVDQLLAVGVQKGRAEAVGDASYKALAKQMEKAAREAIDINDACQVWLAHEIVEEGKELVGKFEFFPSDMTKIMKSIDKEYDFSG